MDRLMPLISILIHVVGQQYFSHIAQLTKHPDITGSSKSPEVDRLWGHPFDGKFPLGCLVVALFLYHSRQTKVCQLNTVMG